MSTSVVLVAILALLIGLIGGGWFGRHNALTKQTQRDNHLEKEAQAEAARILGQAKTEAEELKTQADQLQQNANQTRNEAEKRIQEATERETSLGAEIAKLDVRREQTSALRQQLEQERLQAQQDTQNERKALSADRKETRNEREELKREIERLNRRAEQLDVRSDKLDAIEERLNAGLRQLQTDTEEIQERSKNIDLKLYEVASLTPEAAREQILTQVDAALAEEKAVRIKLMTEKVSAEAKRQAQHIITQAIQRNASETSASTSVSVVPIPNEAMKGRLIGREGRNIRSFEALTGVDLIIDDTPEAVILSSFNPIRRSVAQHVLQELVADGRIHPSRIEEMVGKAQEDMRTFMHQQGEEAAIESGVLGLKAGMIQLLGRLYFRSSYGQNVLKHSIQVAHLTGIMAAELGLDALLARRCGLMHDVGKSIDREIDGTHVDIGVSLGKRFAEPPEVIDAIAHHHDPEHGETLYSVLVAAADAISAARPGARREELEAYVRRLEQLEQIAVSFPGVQQAYAIQAGREVRVIVQPEKVTDAQSTLLAHDIAGRIEQDMEYPGQVQVTVVRESRATHIAK